MSEPVEIEIHDAEGRLLLAMQVFGGRVVRRQPEGDSRPAASASRPSNERHGGNSGGGRAAYGKSILPALNAAREAASLADGRGAGILADFLGLEKLTVKAVEEWLDEDTRRTLEDLMHGARELASRRGGRR